MSRSQITIAPQAPISSHPAFAPLIITWLAALLGGSIAVLPPAMLEIGAAPVGFAMSQMAIAGLAALLGAGVGWAAAKLIARMQRQERPRREPARLEVDEAVAVTITPLTIAEIEQASEPKEALPAAHAEQIEIFEADETDADIPIIEAFAVPIAAEPADAPCFADVSLSDLLGAPKAQAGDNAPNSQVEQEPIEQQVEYAEFEPVIKERAESEQAVVDPAPVPEPIQHGKAVNLLRTHATQELAMPQLIERFAVALDDQRKLAQQLSHSYSYPARPQHMTERLRMLMRAPQGAS